MNKLTIASTQSDANFSSKVAHLLHTNLIPITMTNYADGNKKRQFSRSIRGNDIYIIASLHGTSPIGSAVRLENLKYLIHAAKLASASRVTVVITYFEGRDDRKSSPRMDITALRWANEIVNAGADRVITMDLHADQIVGFFDPIPVDHLFASLNLIPAIKRMHIKNLVLVSPDVGGSKRIEKYADYLNAVDIAFITKRRPRPNAIKEMRISGNVSGKNCLLLDDLIDTAGTFFNATTKLREMEANEIHACGIHSLMSGDAVRMIQKSKLTSLTVTDTIPLQPDADFHTKLNIISVTDIFAAAISAAHRGTSISHLFIENKN
ncbi:MAG: ribose-phosphate diphosphokinase [Patescibacteria group bacterium]